MMKRFRISRQHQQGAVLIVSMILLLVMTILALSGSQVVRMQERMAGNARDSDLAFQGAEAALRDAEQSIELLTAWPATVCTSNAATGCVMFEIGTLRPTTTFDLKTQARTWWATSGREYRTAATTDLAGISADPKYVIEKNGFVCDSAESPCPESEALFYFRTTAQSHGGTPTSDARLESTYVRRAP